VLRDDLDVQVILAPIDVAVLDSTVREMDLAVEEWQVMIVRPPFDFAVVAIRPAVRLGPVSVPFLQPLLVLALQLVIDADAADLQTARFELRGFTLVGAIDLGVVFQFSLAFEAGVKGLACVLVAVAIGFKHTMAAVREHHGLITVTRHPNGLNQTLFSKMSEVAIARIARPAGIVTKIAGRHDAKRSNGGKGSAL
jgi:hypothetical protein